jgi:tetratricopeptide (TPR) repeat protein
MDEFDAAIDLKPDYAPVYYQRGQAYEAAGETDDAVDDFQHYLDLAPDGPFADAAAAAIERLSQPDEPSAEQVDPRPLNVEIAFRSDETDIDSRFMDRLEAALRAHDIDPTFILPDDVEDHPNFWEQPTIRLNTFLSGDLIALRISPYSTFTLPASPILEAAPSAAVGVTFTTDRTAATDAAIDLITGVALYVVGDCPAAMPYLEAARRGKGREDNDPYTSRGMTVYEANCAILDGDLEGALGLLETVEPETDEDLDFADAIAINLAWLRIQLDRPNAFNTLNRVMERADSFSTFWLLRALTKRSQLYALDFQFEKAIADMDAAIDFATTANAQSATTEVDSEAMAQLYIERGQRILLTYEWDDVLTDYDRAIEIAPTYAPGYYYRGILFYTQGKRDEAAADFARYVELAPEGEFAADANDYIASIQVELEALSDE